MTTLYENEYQVRSVTARYQREAAEANQRALADDGHAYGAKGAAKALVHTFHHVVNAARAHSRHASTPILKSGSPATFLHSPE
jgi:hypothetical protein